ncbi:MAG: hypothetical protein JJ863_10550 [Deltaproteobacteria bacterium]|nr:hypothetical protein [Deltaproteobacteria bacterium]
MSDSTLTVECAAHGSCIATFVCTHLSVGVGCGFNHPDDPDDPYPDSWCDACDALYMREGDWTEAATAFADVTLLCSGCWVAARSRNAPNEWTEGLSAPTTESEREGLVERCCAEAQRRNDHSDAATSFLAFPRWDFDASAKTLTFSGPDDELVADVEVIGSFTERSNTWLWGWANHTLDPYLVGQVARLETFGFVRGWEALTTSEQRPSSLEEAWHFAALATVLTEGEALYRAPMEDHLHTFLLIRRFRDRTLSPTA